MLGRNRSSCAPWAFADGLQREGPLNAVNARGDPHAARIGLDSVVEDGAHITAHHFLEVRPGHEDCAGLVEDR